MTIETVKCTSCGAVRRLLEAGAIPEGQPRSRAYVLAVVAYALGVLVGSLL